MTYQPPGILEQLDDETSDDDMENEGDEDDAPVIPEDANDQPGTSGGDQRPLLRFIQPSKKRRVSGKRNLESWLLLLTPTTEKREPASMLAVSFLYVLCP